MGRHTTPVRSVRFAELGSPTLFHGERERRGGGGESQLLAQLYLPVLHQTKWRNRKLPSFVGASNTQITTAESREVTNGQQSHLARPRETFLQSIRAPRDMIVTAREVKNVRTESREASSAWPRERIKIVRNDYKLAVIARSRETHID